MLKKILSVMTVVAMLFSCVAFAAETGETAFRLEGEHFALTVDGVETELTANVIQSTWEGQSNGAGFYWSKNMPAVLSADFYVKEAGYYKMKYVANVFSAVNAWQNQYSVTVNEKTFSGGDAVNTGENPLLGTGTEAVYTTLVNLKKGINTITFEPTTATSSGAYLLYLDYVEFVPSEYEEIIRCVDLKSIFDAGTHSTGINNENAGVYKSSTKDTIELEVNADVEGKYRLVWSATKNTYSGWMSSYSAYINDEPITAITYSSTPGKHGNYVDHTTEVNLKKGKNILKFVLNLDKNPEDGEHYLIYCDYAKFTKIAEDVKNGVITIEGESPSATDGANVLASNVIYDSYTKDESGNKVKDEVSKISGGFQLISTTKIPATVTYSAKVPASGTYSMALDLFAQIANQTWLSPVAVTIMQNGSPVIENVVINSDGDYKAYDVVDGEKVQSIEKCDITVDNGTLLYSTTYGNDIYRYNYLDSIELAEGDMELIITALEERNTGAGLETLKIGDGYFGLDKITLTKNFDAEKALISAEKDIMNVGEAQKLAVTDEMNISASDDYIIEWSTSDENIAVVNEDGLLEAKNPGKAVITAQIKGNSTTSVEMEVAVVAQTQQLMVHSASVNGNNVVVKYTAFADINENNKVTFISGRFPSEGSALEEVKALPIETTASNICRLATIEMDDVAGNIKLFTWKSIDELVPVFKVIDVK